MMGLVMFIRTTRQADKNYGLDALAPVHRVGQSDVIVVVVLLSVSQA